MKIWLITSFLLAFLLGCHRPLAVPEASDPVYSDLQIQISHTITDINRIKKDLEKAKADYDNAPIRTGQRQDAQEVYFQTQHDYEKAAEVYRYLAVKIRQLKEDDRTAYAKAFKEGKKWPDPELYKTYLLDKKLADAPREWNPDANLHKRVPASEEKPKAAAPKEAASGEH